jgi:hypothetical protein
MKEICSVRALSRDTLKELIEEYMRSWFKSTCIEGLNRVGIVSNPIPLKMEIEPIYENGSFNKLKQ